MERLYYDIELPLCPVLYRMEKTGILVDTDQLTRFGEMLAEGIDRCASGTEAA